MLVYLDLAEGSLTICLVLKGGNFFDGDFFLLDGIEGWHHHSVSALANIVEVGVSRRNIEHLAADRLYGPLSRRDLNRKGHEISQIMEQEGVRTPNALLRTPTWKLYFYCIGNLHKLVCFKRIHPPFSINWAVLNHYLHDSRMNQRLEIGDVDPSFWFSDGTVCKRCLYQLVEIKRSSWKRTWQHAEIRCKFRKKVGCQTNKETRMGNNGCCFGEGMRWKSIDKDNGKIEICKMSVVVSMAHPKYCFIIDNIVPSSSHRGSHNLATQCDPWKKDKNN